MITKKSAIIFVTVLFVLSSCGGGALNFADPAGEAVTGGTSTEDPSVASGTPGPAGPAGAQGEAGGQGPAGAQGPAGPAGSSATIPLGIWLNGVNYIDFFSSSEGLVIQSADSTAAAAPAGAFNGAGTGNKALVGLANYDGVLVSDIASISVTARLDRGTSFFYFNMQVDCDGDGAFNAANDGIVVVDSDTLADFILPAGVFTTIGLDPADAVYKMVGGPKAACGNLPSHLGVAGLPLSALPATARLWNGSTGDNGMPRATDLAAIMFIMGDSVNKQFRQITIDSISVNGDVYSFE